MPRSAILVACVGLVMAGNVYAQWTDERDPAVEVPPGIPVTEGRFNAALQYHMVWSVLRPVLEYGDFTSDELDAMDNGVVP